MEYDAVPDDFDYDVGYDSDDFVDDALVDVGSADVVDILVAELVVASTVVVDVEVAFDAFVGLVVAEPVEAVVVA